MNINSRSALGGALATTSKGFGPEGIAIDAAVIPSGSILNSTETGDGASLITGYLL